MRDNPEAHLQALVAADAIACFGSTAPAMAADDFTLTITPQSQAVVGRSMIINTTGTIPSQFLQYFYYFSLDAIPTSLTTTCPASYESAPQFAGQPGGAVLAIGVGEHPDAAGNFSISTAVTPSAAGSVLLCAYTEDGESNSLVVASLILNIQPGPSTGAGSGSPGPSTGAGSGPPGPSTGAGSGRPSPPAEMLASIRSCRALLGPSDAKGCIRDAIKRENARCRRLRSRRGRSSCLSAVARVVRRSS